MITVVDIGSGNIASVLNMFKRTGVAAEVQNAPERVAKARSLVIPGVGHFGACMDRVEQTGLRAALDEAALGRRVPVLGICVGMQLMMAHGQEGDRAGLGWIEGEVVRLPTDAVPDGRVPHMGWNTVEVVRDDPLFVGLEATPRFYFVHSYHARCADESDVLGRTDYGIALTAAIQRGHLRGVQFHPEKSHRFGMQVLRNFAALVEAT
jgi:glutamine amidotransferase